MFKLGRVDQAGGGGGGGGPRPRLMRQVGEEFTEHVLITWILLNGKKKMFE